MTTADRFYRVPEESVGSGLNGTPDPAPIIETPALTTAESRRIFALEKAVDCVGTKDAYQNASELAGEFVEAAKVFEAYLKGEAQ